MEVLRRFFQLLILDSTVYVKLSQCILFHFHCKTSSPFHHDFYQYDHNPKIMNFQDLFNITQINMFINNDIIIVIIIKIIPVQK